MGLLVLLIGLVPFVPMHSGVNVNVFRYDREQFSLEDWRDFAASKKSGLRSMIQCAGICSANKQVGCHGYVMDKGDCYQLHLLASLANNVAPASDSESYKVFIEVDFLKSDFLAPMPSSMTQSDLIVKTISNVSHKLFCMILCLKESVLACDFVIFEENEFKCQFGDLNAAVASPSQFDDGEIIVKTDSFEEPVLHTVQSKVMYIGVLETFVPDDRDVSCSTKLLVLPADFICHCGEGQCSLGRPLHIESSVEKVLSPGDVLSFSKSFAASSSSFLSIDFSASVYPFDPSHLVAGRYDVAEESLCVSICVLQASGCDFYAFDADTGTCQTVDALNSEGLDLAFDNFPGATINLGTHSYGGVAPGSKNLQEYNFKLDVLNHHIELVFTENVETWTNELCSLLCTISGVCDAFEDVSETSNACKLYRANGMLHQMKLHADHQAGNILQLFVSKTAEVATRLHATLSIYGQSKTTDYTFHSGVSPQVPTSSMPSYPHVIGHMPFLWYDTSGRFLYCQTFRINEADTTYYSPRSCYSWSGVTGEGFVPIASMIAPHSNGAFAVLDGGARAWAAGGQEFTGPATPNPTLSTEIFDGTSWTMGAVNFPSSITEPAAVEIAPNIVLMYGWGENWSTETWRLNLLTGAINTMDLMPLAGKFPSQGVVTVHNDKLFVEKVGGWYAGSHTQQHHRYDVDADKWEVIFDNPSPYGPRIGSAAVPLQDRSGFVLFGGELGQFTTTFGLDAWLYTRTTSWVRLADEMEFAGLPRAALGP